MGKKRTNGKLALVYDFDGTLIDGTVVDEIINKLGWDDADDFWGKRDDFAEQHEMEKNCCYMHLLLEEARKQGCPLTADYMKEVGSRLQMRKGLVGNPSWFGEINKACEKYGLEPEHYIITSGLAEIVDAISIRKEFTHVFGSRFHYDENGVAVCPARVVNYTTKTQYLFRINKGLFDETKEDEPNKFMEEDEREVPFERMIFIGDGFTDIPCFSLVKKYGGVAVGVLRLGNSDKAMQGLEQLVADARVDLISLTSHFEQKGRLLESLRRVIKRKAREAEIRRHIQPV